MTANPGAATGQTPYEPTRCVCGHLDTFHKPNERTGVRGACSATTTDFTCPCKKPTTGENQ